MFKTLTAKEAIQRTSGFLNLSIIFPTWISNGCELKRRCDSGIVSGSGDCRIVAGIICWQHHYIEELEKRINEIKEIL